MLEPERHEQLLELCAQRGMVTVAQAATIFGISEMTARRDFDELSRRAGVIREYGGIRLSSGSPIAEEVPFFEKLSIRSPEKEHIARTAVNLIRERDTIFLGPGSTCALIARALPRMRLRVITNSIIVLNMLQTRNDVEIWALGGQYRKRSGSFVGPIAEDALAPLGIDTCFIGTNGVLAQSISCSNLEEGRLQALACDRAAKRYLVCDSSKIGQMDFFGFFNLDQMDALITDANVNDKQRSMVLESTRIIVAE